MGIDAPALDGFELSSFSALGKEFPVYRAGSGPAVIVVHEVPGITPLVAGFGRKVADAGLTAVLPSLFGTPGKPMTGAYAGKVVAQCCISREFATLAMNKTSPITEWLRELARAEHARCGGPGVGAVGMCMTGGFALAMMVDPVVQAPVLSQPSLPFPLGKKRRAAVGISDADFAKVKERVAEGTCVLGLRFTNDPTVRPERFETLRRELGDGFIAVEIDSSPGNPYGNPKSAHSVLTQHLVDQPGHPTREALDKVLTFFRERLGVA
jgi:dienelactone hydrolase